jgi:stearoyl-CoA desaturase (delta-9 desaturase)
VTIGFHRLFTHRSFETGRIMQAVLAVLGSMAVEGSLLHWVATHRCHHQHSDGAEDPHSPHHDGTGLVNMARGFWRAHVGWILEPTRGDLGRYVADFEGDRFVRTLSALFPVWVAIGLLIPAVVAGAVSGSWSGALFGVLWGGLVRVFLVHHMTWSINSVCHIWGTRAFRCRDQSRNNAIFGVLGFGEGWHNNHHAFPTSARHGLKWWELDLSYLIIRLMATLGLAWSVRVPAPDRIAAKRR